MSVRTPLLLLALLALATPVSSAIRGFDPPENVTPVTAWFQWDGVTGCEPTDPLTGSIYLAPGSFVSHEPAGADTRYRVNLQGIPGSQCPGFAVFIITPLAPWPQGASSTFTMPCGASGTIVASTSATAHRFSLWGNYPAGCIDGVVGQFGFGFDVLRVPV